MGFSAAKGARAKNAQAIEDISLELEPITDTGIARVLPDQEKPPHEERVVLRRPGGKWRTRRRAPIEKPRNRGHETRTPKSGSSLVRALDPLWLLLDVALVLALLAIFAPRLEDSTPAPFGKPLAGSRPSRPLPHFREALKALPVKFTK